jgi:hypothetical protein
VADLHRARDIWGDSVIKLKGATRVAAQKRILRAEEPDIRGEVPLVWRELELHGDIAFIEGDPWLVTVSKPLSLTMITGVWNKRSAPLLMESLQKHIDGYIGRGFTIQAFRSDSEGPFLALQSQLEAQGIAFDPASPGAHDPYVEAAIKVLKNTVRGVKCSLQFQLPRVLFRALVRYAVIRKNQFPPSGSSGALSVMWKSSKLPSRCENTIW